MDKEMDLQKFIIRQRLQTTAILALLKGRQTFIVDKMSQLVLHDSTDFEEQSSSNDDLNRITQQAFNNSYKRMVRSTDVTDRRLLD